MKNIIAVCLISILATGYASQGITSIKPEERDRSGKFDGGWIGSAHIKRQAPTYEGSTGGWVRLLCNDDSSWDDRERPVIDTDLSCAVR